jgi:hypothetical protein
MMHAQVANRALQASPHEAQHRRPPVLPRQAGGLSGRPFCRIYNAAQHWVLEIDPASGGWLEQPEGPQGKASRRLVFRTLIDAIAYAERHGLDYRVVPPPRNFAPVLNAHGSSLPRSWLARLARDGRRGDIYHG